jgi:hypothetical protein
MEDVEKRFGSRQNKSAANTGLQSISAGLVNGTGALVSTATMICPCLLIRQRKN